MSKQINSQSAIDGFGALANRSRLAIFRLLVRKGPHGMAAGEIADALDCPASSLSFHLANLTRAGLIEQRREGRSLIYSVSSEQVVALMRFLLEDCCGGRSEVCGPLGVLARELSPTLLK